MRVILGFWVVVCCGSVSLVGCSAQQGSQERVSWESAPLIAIGPEIGTEAAVLIQKDLGWTPSVGTDGTGFLSATTIAGAVRGVRVDGSGRVLDPVWLSIGGAPRVGADQLYPHVAFGAGRYLVTWTEAEIPDDFSSNVVRGRFVDPDGTVQGTGSFVISARNALYSTAAWNGSSFVVGWLGLGAPGEGTTLQTVLLDANGVPVAGSQRTVSSTGTAGEPRLAVSANQALIAWYEYVQSPTGETTSTIHGARIAPDGSILDPGGRPLSDGGKYQDKVQVASDGSGFLVVWKSGYDPDVVRGSLVAADGSVVARDFAIPATSARSSVPSVAFDGSRYLVAWADERDEQSVYGVHVSTAGVVADDETRLTHGSPRSVDSSDRTGLAFNGSKFLLTYLGKGVQGSLLSPDLDIEVDTIGLSAVPNPQGYPQVAWSGENYFVSWVNELAEWTDSSARAVRISTSGRVLDPVALVVSGDDKPFNSMLASNGQDSALFSWSNVQDVRSHWLRTVTSAGVLGAAHEFPGVESASYVALAGNGTSYFAVIDNSDAGRVEGYVLDGAGNPGAKIDLATSGFNTGSNVFAAGGGYVVTFGGPGTRLVPVSAEGVPGAEIQLSAELAHPDVATNGEHSLIVWAGIDTQTVYAQRFEAGALVGSPIVVVEQNGKYPTVAWDGTGYFVAWDVEGYTAIQGRPVAVDGTLGDVTVLAETEVSGATLASDGEGQLLLSYIRWLEKAQTRRVTSRLLGRDASAPSEGGAGGEGNIAGSSSTGGSNTGAAGESNTGGTSASGGTPNAGTAGEATTAGTSAAGSGGAAGSSGSSASGSGGGAGDGAGTAGTGGSQLPPLPGCSTAPGQSGSGGLPLWLGAALLGFGFVGRRRGYGAAR